MKDDYYRYNRKNQEIIDFVEEYKKCEQDPIVFDRLNMIRFKRNNVKAEAVTYNKIKYVYKGRTYFRKVVSKYSKGA